MLISFFFVFIFINITYIINIIIIKLIITNINNNSKVALFDIYGKLINFFFVILKIDNDESVKSSNSKLAITTTKASDALKLVNKTPGKRIKKIVNELNTAVVVSATPNVVTSSPVITVSNVDTNKTTSEQSINTTSLPSSNISIPIESPANLIVDNNNIATQQKAVNTTTTKASLNNNSTTLNGSANSTTTTTTTTTSSKLNKTNYSLSATTNTFKQQKQHSNNKENQQGKMPKSCKLILNIKI